MLIWRTDRSADPARVAGSRARRLTGVTALTVTAAALGGCALDAGTAANEQFEEHMADVAGVTTAEGHLSNTLPFAGTGTVELWLDTSAPREVLDEAVEHALAFSPGFGVNATVMTIDLRTGWGEPVEPDAEFGSVASVELAWDDPPGPAIDELLAQRGAPPTVRYPAAPVTTP